LKKPSTIGSNRAIHELTFKRPIVKVETWLSERDIGPLQTEVWIYPLYPGGYQAIVAVWDRIWIFEEIKGRFRIADIQHVKGFSRNGIPIVTKFN